MSEKRVLLTGATGLIGRQCIAPLKQAGWHVLAISRNTSDVAGVEVLAADILDPSDVDRAVASAKADALVHLAWYDGPDRWSSPSNLDWAAATIRLVRTFANHGGRRVVAVGSCAEYDWAEEVLAETSPLRPASLYGASKASAALALIGAAPALNLSLAWARIFFCYGPGEPEGRLLGDLIRGLSRGDTVDCTDGLQERDFLHTADIARALVAVLQDDIDGAINIGQGTATPVRDVIGTVARQMGKPDLIRLGARPRPDDDPARIVAEVSRLRDEVGFKPAFTLATGIADILRADGAA